MNIISIVVWLFFSAVAICSNPHQHYPITTFNEEQLYHKNSGNNFPNNLDVCNVNLGEQTNYGSFNDATIITPSLANIPLGTSRPTADHDCFTSGINVQCINGQYRAFCRTCFKETSVFILPPRQDNFYQTNNLNQVFMPTLNMQSNRYMPHYYSQPGSNLPPSFNGEQLPHHFPMTAPLSFNQFADQGYYEGQNVQGFSTPVTGANVSKTTSPKEAKRAFSQDSQDEDEKKQRKTRAVKRSREKSGKSPVFYAFVKCAYDKEHAKIINIEIGEIEIIDEMKFFDCIKANVNKDTPTQSADRRRKSLRTFINNYPSKDTYQQGNFFVRIKEDKIQHKNSTETTSKLVEFKALVAQFDAEKQRPAKRLKT